MTLREDLVAAKALIDTPEKWAHLDDDRAVWHNGIGPLCAVDACSRLGDGRIIGALERHLPGGREKWRGGMVPVAMFNDDPRTTHADIMALFDRAIEAAS